ncbi:hypothetical protein BCR44DRAFT_40703 [Catenaria anguillulae PL171]|uniref:Uncharacterized protein n=1 Tax=Catenaria anguillulae PL171 TaxID=765915 RepID=A0A1Y2H973_9FUNG|nr:hypothetical protein BCR44DRAFT_40703 [Catenaria anguillulae PL171]
MRLNTPRSCHSRSIAPRCRLNGHILKYRREKKSLQCLLDSLVESTDVEKLELGRARADLSESLMPYNLIVSEEA